MSVGDSSFFAIESEMSRAYARASFRGLGFFLIHLGGMAYGVRDPSATLLACSFDQVGVRLESRGTHLAFFASVPDAGKLADAVVSAIYGPEGDDVPALGVAPQQIRQILHSNGIIWAPDGDEAFDDGSCVLQFDIGRCVRVIGFRRESYRHEPSSLRDVWLEADCFYDVLRRWRSGFWDEWKAAPKEPEP